jgi:SNF2 family DNA or RNA helicase
MVNQDVISFSGIKDNRDRGSVGKFLTNNIKDRSVLSFVSAYFTIYAYESLKNKLDNIDNLRFLFGEPKFLKTLDPQKSDKKHFKIDDDSIKLENVLEQKRIAKDCADWIEKKVEIKSIKKTGLLHGKMYHVDNNGVQSAIMGSSNFTMRGLGFSNKSNIELNMIIDSDRDRKDLKNWFEELWENKELVDDVKAEVLTYLSQLYVNHAPEFIYYKTLFHLFEKDLEHQKQGNILTQQYHLKDSQVWKTLYEFQQHGVIGAINKLKKHNGCIIADSVGLGKTFEALAIIKNFELLNERVLVLCPKKLKENWTVYQAYLNHDLNQFPQDRFGYTVLCHTDLSREGGKSGDIELSSFNWGAFDLVVIDESHNFRNNTKGKDDKKSRYEKLMDDIIKSGQKTKVLLLSATPVNTNLRDIRNQIYFFTEGDDTKFNTSMGIENLKDTIANAQREFTNWANTQKESRNSKDLLDKLPSTFIKLLDELTIARSRKHIVRYYQSELERIGAFPKRLKPLSFSTDIDTNDMFLSYDKLDHEIEEYKLSLFSPSKYVKPEFFDKYGIKKKEAGTKGAYGDTQTRENYLIGMMKINFLKRLESSIESFEITMKRTVDKIVALETKIKEFKELKKIEKEKAKVSVEQTDEDDNELTNAQETIGALEYNLEHLNLDEWIKDLKEDKKQLNNLYLAAKDVTVERDAKLKEFKELIKNKIENPTTNSNGVLNKKILIFTAFSDTANYLYDCINEWVKKDLKTDIALVVGSGDNKTTYKPTGFKNLTEFNRILTNFSPNSKLRAKNDKMPQVGEIDILIATDCISEGQNLQDCDYVINYDIHWNPVRIIQRFGRIDRIGSKNKEIQMVNFWPTDDLNKYINLKNSVESRMALVDLTATGEDDVLNGEQLQDQLSDDVKYRDKQLLKLKDEILDLEDMTDSISLSDFSLEDFRIDLMQFIENNKDLLEDAPLGLYSIVPSPSDKFSHVIDYTNLDDQTKNVIAPGIVFCLRQKGDTKGNEQLNPLQPYFLVYIRQDGTTRFNYVHVKQILEIYRILCGGQSQVIEALCNIFDEETQNGQDMTVYSELLNKAVNSIVGTFKKKAGASLFTKDGVIPDVKKQLNDTENFELITWLIIK